MAQLRSFIAFGIAAIMAAFCVGSPAQSGDPAAIQQKLTSHFKLTKTTADRTDIVTAGDVVVLQKDGLMMCSADSPYPYSNSYSNGVLSGNQKNRAKNALKSFGHGFIPVVGGGASADAANNACASRKFVAGEKFWITAVTAQKDGIVVSTYSDPYNDVRFYGEIKFPFQKDSVPPTDDFVKTVSEVITVQPGDDKGGQGDQDNQQQPTQAPAQAPAPPPASYSSIAPPQPPADAPAISLGQTKDQVVATFGQPDKKAKVGAKEVYYYKDMKVTFTASKVTDVD
jgi:hypothetical protein